jgi:hypothetical protein
MRHKRTFPDTYGVFCDTINSWRGRELSRHRHGERHGEIDLGRLLSRCHDDDMTLMTVIYGLILDEGMRRYFVGSLTPSP